MTRADSSLREVLAESDLFETLEDEHLDQLAAVTREKEYEPGAVVYTRGESAQALYVVTAGQFKAVATAEDGREIVLRLLDPGAVFGEIALLDGKPRTATMIASKRSKLAAIHRRDLLKLMRATPDIALNLLAVMASRLRSTTEQFEDTSFLLLPARLARRVLMLLEEYGEPDSKSEGVKIKMAQEELGQLVATSRVSVNQQLKAWEADGVLKTSRGAITVFDRDALEVAAQAEG
jgi:CRP-like cAMP-binding protein